MEYVTSLGAYMVAFLVALLVAARWLLKHDPALRAEPFRDPDSPTSARPGD
ncbi:hypothetical protein [Cupriavidus numazuensis]|uniref:CcoQ/FixQ family Cbb3-type cytochrome c oxidase assembly chaperone n=1 Tax=Cupriavidus numazuensis TaxID=221992 RepID=A0ABM8TK21_9BURK|nr:hypothetical protein [Cupriavidus numazuensis]CAG2150885.1 hypothetical protein LMG26411_03834 [Cupriavidus numazuensis]